MSLIEALIVLALMGLMLAMAMGAFGMPRKNQKTLLYTARQISHDIRSAVEISRTRSTELSIEITTDGYTIYIENNDPADGWQKGEEIIEKGTFPAGVTLAEPTNMPAEWKTRLVKDGTEEFRFPEIIKDKDILLLNASGLTEGQKVLGLNFPKAPVYQTICVRLFNSGDSDVYRYIEGAKKWVSAPLG